MYIHLIAERHNESSFFRNGMRSPFIPLVKHDFYATIDPASTPTWKRLEILQFQFFPEEGCSSSNPADLYVITEKCCTCCLNWTWSTLHKILFSSAAHISLSNHKLQKIIKNSVPQKHSLDLARGYSAGWVLCLWIVVLCNTCISSQTIQPVAGMHLLVQYKFSNSVTCLFN